MSELIEHKIEQIHQQSDKLGESLLRMGQVRKKSITGVNAEHNSSFHKVFSDFSKLKKKIELLQKKHMPGI